MNDATSSDLFRWATQQKRKRPARRYGFAAALAVVVEHGRRQLPSTSARAARDPVARCPRCGLEGPVKEHFGYRTVHGRSRPQSWCRDCRAEKGGEAECAQDLPLLSWAH